jgi:pre-mRNA-splicing helicase BRR2
MAQPSYDSPHFKAFVLLQAHFSRMQLPIDLAKDQEIILTKVLGLLSATVDVLSSDGHINAMNAMEMSQMVVQAMWDRDSPLKQIPHFTPEVIKAANESGYVCSTPCKSLDANYETLHRIKDIFEFMDAMDPENPNYATLIKNLGLSQNQLVQAANFTNSKYPNIELDFEVEDPDEIIAGAPAYIKVKITREVDEDEESVELDSTVHAPFYPVKNKMENWWLVVGEESSKTLLAIKRITIGRALNLRLEYTVPTPGEHELKLFLMSDSYVGVDQDPSFTVNVAEGMDEDEDEDDEEDQE